MQSILESIGVKYTNKTVDGHLLYMLEHSEIPVCWEAIEKRGMVGYFDSKRFVEPTSADILSRRGYATRIGKFIKRLASSLPDQVVAELAEEYVSRFGPCPKIYGPEEVMSIYDGNNYAGSGIGTLETSCMRHDPRLMAVYAENNVHIVAIKNESGYVMARGLLWYNVTDEDGKADYTILDRCYGSPDNIIKMKNFAKSQGFMYRINNGCGPSRDFHHPEKGDLSLQLYYQLKNWEVPVWPYIDTFQYYFGDGLLSNCANGRGKSVICRLDCTNGDGPGNATICSHCEHRYREGDITYVDDCPVCTRCLRQYYRNLNGRYYHIDDISTCGVCGRYRPNENVTLAHDGKYVCTNCLDNYVLLEGTLYHKSELAKCEFCRQNFVVADQDITPVENGGVICDTCRDMHYEYIEEKDMYFIKKE